MKRIKVVVIGAGSKSFGRGMIADLLSLEELRDTNLTISLVDVNETLLNQMFRFAKLIKEYRASDAEIYATTDRCEALKGANYVITAVAQRRWELWDRDFYTPLSFGFKHVTGECAGPGAAFHTLRSLHLMIPIARDIEKLCPNALLINFTNPESRVCLGIRMLTKIRVIGLCHGAFATLHTVARILSKKKEEIDITIGGINHFHWVLAIYNKITGEDLYPEFHQRMRNPNIDLQPLTKLMYKTFGLLPFPVDNHIGEFVQFAYDETGPLWKWSGGDLSYKPTPEEIEEAKEHLKNTYGDTILEEHPPIEMMQQVIEGKKPMTEQLAYPSGELAIPIICDIEFNKKQRELSVNVPNDNSAISNLPEDAIVEVPAIVDAEGIHPVKIGSLPEPIAAICRLQVSIQKLLVEAYAQRSKKKLLQALVLDPTVNSISRAEKLINIMLRVERDFLPEFENDL
jgi:alpha-galactosidase